jgi:chorismate synthase
MFKRSNAAFSLLYCSYGESHCKSVGVLIDGVPPLLELTEADIQPQLTRRRPGQSAITTQRNEKDRVEIQSGTEHGVTLGSVVALRVMNEDHRPTDYKNGTMDQFPRPSHADWTYQEKYGVRASSGGGRASARETIGRVAAGAVAEKILSILYGVEIVAFTASVGNEFLFPPTPEYPHHSQNPEFIKLIDSISRETVDAHAPTRCPDAKVAARMEALITKFRDAHDSIGGTIVCVARNIPAGLGEPCFDKLEAKLAHAMLSLPATKGFEIGSGFGGCAVPGSVHNDPFVKALAVNGPAHASRPRLTTKTNNSGGIQGGISNGAHIYFSVAFKPPATIGLPQPTVSYDEEEGVLEAKGRHDPCVIGRAIPIVEGMASLVLMDALLAQKAREGVRDALVASRNAA